MSNKAKRMPAMNNLLCIHRLVILEGLNAIFGRLLKLYFVTVTFTVAKFKNG